MPNSDNKTAKDEIAVDVRFRDGTRLRGFLVLAQTQRLTDLLNEPADFLSLRKADGLVTHLRKRHIAAVTE